MHTDLHYTQIDIRAEVAAHVTRISQELETLRRDDELHVDISPQELFHLEALGYLVNLSTGMVVRNSDHSLAALGA